MSATQRVIIVGGGPNLLQEIDNGGNVLSRYTQGAYVDELLSELRSGTASYYEEDGRDPSLLSAIRQAHLRTLIRTIRFGKLTASTGTIVNPFQYTRPATSHASVGGARFSFRPVLSCGMISRRGVSWKKDSALCLRY
jgi:hypothetical protein